MVYRRDGSPGYRRSRSRSPSMSRGRSRSYSRSLSPRGRPLSRSRSRSRSRGPPMGRWGGGSSPGYPVGRGPRGPPIRGRSPPFRKYSRSPSRSRSLGRRSRSRTPSSEEGQIHAAPSQRRQVKKRVGDADLAAQLQALKQQLEAEQIARAAAEGKLEFLKGKVRDVAERSKSRGNMLAQLTIAMTRVADAKQRLQDAEGDLQQALAAAEAYLQEDAPAAPAPPATTAEAEPASPRNEQAEMQQQQQQQQQPTTAANGHAADVAVAAADTAADTTAADTTGRQEGGWVEAAPAPSAGPLQNIKFKLKL